MTRAVKLVSLKDVCPALIPVFDCVVGVKITVLILGGGDKLNKTVGGFFEIFVGMNAQRKGDSLKPFCRIAVLSMLPLTLSS